MVLHEVFGVFVAIIVLAAFATAVSPKAQTAQVLTASEQGFNQVLSTALSPVS